MACDSYNSNATIAPGFTEYVNETCVDDSTGGCFYDDGYEDYIIYYAVSGDVSKVVLEHLSKLELIEFNDYSFFSLLVSAKKKINKRQLPDSFP